MTALIDRYGKDAARIYYQMEKEWSAATKKSAIRKSIKDHPELYKKKETRSKVLTKLKDETK